MTNVLMEAPSAHVCDFKEHQPIPPRKRHVSLRRNRSGSRESHHAHSACAPRPFAGGSHTSTASVDMDLTSTHTRKRHLDTYEDSETPFVAPETPSRTDFEDEEQMHGERDQFRVGGREDVDLQPINADSAPRVAQEAVVSSEGEPHAERVGDGAPVMYDDNHRDHQPSPPPSPARAHTAHKHDEDPSSVPPSSAHEPYACDFNPPVGRTLKIEYWDRTRECKERKWNHLDYIDATFPSREEWILNSVLHEHDTLMEPNMFPYNTPRGIEHWTIWSRKEMTIEEVEEYVCGWIRDSMPHVRRWNVDVNASRSIQLFHMHVYLQTREDGDIEPPVEDYDHRDDEEEEERDEDDREDREDAEDGRDGYSFYSGAEGGVACEGEGEGAEEQCVSSVSPSTWSPRGGVTVQAPGKDGQGYDVHSSTTTTSSTQTPSSSGDDEDDAQPPVKRSRHH